MDVEVLPCLKEPELIDYAWGRCRITLAEINRASEIEQLKAVGSASTTRERGSSARADKTSSSSGGSRKPKKTSNSSGMARKMTRRKSTVAISSSKLSGAPGSSKQGGPVTNSTREWETYFSEFNPEFGSNNLDFGSAFLCSSFEDWGKYLSPVGSGGLTCFTYGNKSFDDLPVDVILIILSNLDINCTAQIRYVSRSWGQIASHPEYLGAMFTKAQAKLAEGCKLDSSLWTETVREDWFSRNDEPNEDESDHDAQTLSRFVLPHSIKTQPFRTEDDVSRAGSFRGSYGRSRNVVKRIALVDTLFHDKNTIREGCEPQNTPDPSALPNAHSDTNTEKSETTEKSDHTHGETQRSSDTSDPQTGTDFKRSGQNEIESPTNTEDTPNVSTQTGDESTTPEGDAPQPLAIPPAIAEEDTGDHSSDISPKAEATTSPDPPEKHEQPPPPITTITPPEDKPPAVESPTKSDHRRGSADHSRRASGDHSRRASADPPRRGSDHSRRASGDHSRRSSTADPRRQSIDLPASPVVRRSSSGGPLLADAPSLGVTLESGLESSGGLPAAASSGGETSGGGTSQDPFDFEVGSKSAAKINLKEITLSDGPSAQYFKTDKPDGQTPPPKPETAAPLKTSISAGNLAKTIDKDNKSQRSQSRSDISTAPLPSELTINHLIALMTSVLPTEDNSEPIMSVECFSVMFPCFMSTSLLLSKLIQCHFLRLPSLVPGQIPLKRKLKYVQFRVFHLLLRIVVSYYPTMNTDERNLIHTFIPLLAETKLAKFLESIVGHQAAMKAGAPPPPLSASALGAKYDPKQPKTIDIFEFTPLDVAKRLCQLEFEIFKLVKPQEFHKEAWTKKREDALNIRTMIDRFNAITRWIVTLVVTTERIKKRVKRVIFLVQVASALRELNNFHTLMAVLSGISEGPLFRLNFTKAEVPQEVWKTYEAMQAGMSADKSYATYRVGLNDALKKPPGIPYIGVYLRDCTYFGDGLKSMDGLSVNVKKVKGIWDVVQQIQTFQKHPYVWEGQQQRDLTVLDVELAGLPSVTMDEAFELSRLREPRNAKRPDLL